MQVEGHVELLRASPLQEALGVGEEAAVPGIACPCALALLGVVPVHVDHQHIEGDAVGIKVVYQLAQFVVGVAPVARPPVTEGIARRQRHLSRDHGKVAQSLAIVVAIGHEVPVLGFAFLAAVAHPLPVAMVEEIVLRVVDEGPSAAREQTVLDGHGLVAAHIAVISVEGAIGTLEIEGVFLPGAPGKGLDSLAFGRGYEQVAIAERALALGILDDHAAGGYLNGLATVAGGIVYGGVVAVDGHERLSVLKSAVGRVLHTCHAVGDERYAYMAVLVSHVLLGGGGQGDEGGYHCRCRLSSFAYVHNSVADCLLYYI